MKIVAQKNKQCKKRCKNKHDSALQGNIWCKITKTLPICDETTMKLQQLFGNITKSEFSQINSCFAARLQANTNPHYSAILKCSLFWSFRYGKLKKLCWFYMHILKTNAEDRTRQRFHIYCKIYHQIQICPNNFKKFGSQLGDPSHEQSGDLR